VTWKRYCGTVAKAGGNGEHKLRPVVKEGSYLLERTQRKTLCLQKDSPIRETSERVTDRGGDNDFRAF